VDNLYVCEILNQFLPIPKDTKLSIVENHFKNKSHQDVRKIHFSDSKVFLIHPDLVKRFPNIESIEVLKTALTPLDPIENCENITMIWMTKIDLSTVTENLFANCVNLERLRFYKTKIMTISDKSSLWKLSSLEYLIFWSEPIPVLNHLLFESMENLISLEFYNCSVQVIEENAFGNLKNLVEFYMEASKIGVSDLQANQFIVKPNAFAGCQSLDVLEISSTNFKFHSGYELRGDTSGSLDKLLLYDNEIVDINSGAFKDLVHLTYLAMNDNAIRILARDLFQSNKLLKYLNLKKNRIFAVHSGVFQSVQNLEKVELADNDCMKEDLKDVDLNPLTTALEQCFENYENHVIVCDYQNLEFNYNCLVKNTEIKTHSKEVIIGDHILGFSDFDVTIVDFSGSKLLKIPVRVLAKFRYLKELNVAETELKFINDLGNCDHLEKFNASGNQIVTVSNAAFRDCKRLQMIDLSSNRIPRITEDSFKAWGRLKRLYLDNNGIEFIDPKAFIQLDQLQELGLSNNRLGSLKVPFKGLQNLQKLHLNSNQIDSIEPEVFNHLKSLKEINLSDNLLTTFSKIGLPKSLERIAVSNNRIWKIDPEASQEIHNLKWLDLRGNLCVNESFEIQSGLQEIKWKLGNCFVNYLELENHACSFGEVGVDYKCLYENIIVQENHAFFIYGLHQSSKSNSDVTIVEFVSSKLSVIPGAIFKAFQNLDELNVSSTQLSALKPLQSCTKLRKFKCTNNQIEVLDRKVFKECSNLVLINLKYNKIKKVPANIFGSNLKLHRVDLSRNLIKEIQPCEAFQGFKNLAIVDLSGNECINAILHLQNNDLMDIKKKLSLCHSSWILNEIVAKTEL
jgi:Leucine-rich repeat (LRR) protein